MEAHNQIPRRLVLGGSAAATATGFLGHHRAHADDARPVAHPAGGGRVTEDPGTVVRASDFGHEANDSTAHLQAALDSDADTVIIDRVPGGWMTGPLFIRRSDVSVILEPDVMVRAARGAFSDEQASLLTVDGQSNVTVSGYGATIAMNKYEYMTDDSQWRHAIALRSTTSVTIEGLTVRDTGGDCVYVGRQSGVPESCEAVTLRDLTCLNPKRNGLSVTAADGIRVDGCSFLGASGHAPEAGIDIEPNQTYEFIRDVIIENCVIADNNALGLTIGLRRLDATSPAVSVLVRNCRIEGPVDRLPAIMVFGTGEDLDGSIEMRDCLVTTGPGGCTMGVFLKPASGPSLKLTNVTAWNWGNTYYSYPPIVVSSGTYEGTGQFEHYGGPLEFEDFVLVTDQPGPFFVSQNGGEGFSLTDVTGTVTVVSPHEPAVELDDEPTRVTLDVTAESPDTDGPAVDAHVARSVSVGDVATVTFSRRRGDTSTPLAIAYSVTGSAVERRDFGGLGGVAVIPAGARDVQVPIRALPRSSSTDTGARTVAVAIQAGHRYRNAQRVPAFLTIKD